MADEQVPEKDPLEENIPVAEEVPEEAKPEPAPAVKEQLEPIPDLETFWSSIDAQTSAKVTAPIDPPEKIGESSSFNGNLVFKDFATSGHSFSGDAKLIHGLYKDVPNCQLVLPIGGILSAIASVIKEYNKRGEKMGNVIRLAGEAMPTIFSHVFKAIKEKSEKIHWSKGSSEWKATPLVHYIIDPGLDQDMGVNLLATFDGMKSAINEEAQKILSGGKSERSRGRTKDPFFVNQEIVRSFVVNTIPKEMFKQIPAGMFTSLRMDEIENLGGAKVVAAIKAAKGDDNFKQGGDVEDFWFRYDVKADIVLFENKRLSNQMYIDRLRKIYQKYESPNMPALYLDIADKYDVSVEAVKDWFKSLIDKLTPDMKKKVEPIVEDNLKKVAYPNQPWAGPSLEQVGGLVGDAQAKWASELAGTLAARFDYVSYPKLEGSPSDLKKLATLPLSEEQIARVEKYKAKAERLLKDILAAHPSYETDPESGEVAGYTRPDKDEVEMMALDTLLELVDSLPSTTPDDEFLKELKHKLHVAAEEVVRHPHSGWPSRKTSPEDALAHEHTPVENLEEVRMEKKALLKEEDAVQVVPGTPHVPLEFQGQMGKIVDVKIDIGICPTHGPEAFIRYLVEFNPGQMRWFRNDEIRTVATTN